MEAGLKMENSEACCQIIIVPPPTAGVGLGGGRGAEPDKGRQRSWRKTAYATHAWIAAHRLHLFIYFSKIQRPATERSSVKHSSQQGSRDAASVSEHPNGL